MPSFDIVSEVDLQEVDNAVNQTTKEISNRFDFRGINPKIEFDRSTNVIKFSADDESKLEDMLGVLQSKAIKRSIDIQVFKKNKAEPAGGKTFRQKIELVQGIEKDIAKKITSFIKNQKLKVQPAIHDDKVKVTGKKRDDLQTTITALKAENFGLPLQFNNFRD